MAKFALRMIKYQCKCKNMSEAIKKNYYKLNKEEFDLYLSNLKNDPRSVKFFEWLKNNYFFILDDEIVNKILQLNKWQNKLDILYNGYSEEIKHFIKETLLIEEIRTTNATENIYSTRKDIFGLFNDVKSIKDNKVKSILQAYKAIEKEPENNSLESVRELYDIMMKDAYESKDDIPDGKLFRKDIVDISDGIKNVHHGFYPETEIIKGMNDFLSVYSGLKTDIYQRVILSHFLFETVHPFYNGNGRMGRFLMSLQMYKEEKTIGSFVVASSINVNKSKYYKALEKAREIHEFGYLNNYFLDMADIMLEGYQNLIKELTEKEKQMSDSINKLNDLKLTKTEKKMIEYLLKASCYSVYGVNNTQIVEACNISKRSVINILDKIREAGCLVDTKIGLYSYHKIDLSKQFYSK